jgi:pimeloyl-ACP methyl ester carboxylesterase
MTAETYPNKVSRLVLYGAAFAFNVSKEGAHLGKELIESKPGALDTRLPAYQEIDWEHTTLNEWQEMMGDRNLADKEAIAAVATAFYTTDYSIDSKGQRKVRRPTGPLLDMYRVWSNRPAFNAAKIHVPTLVVRGDLDLLAEPTLAARLTGTKIVREVVIKNATHWMLYEKSRDQLLTETSRFLGGS